jgi:hypothetical protein
MVLLVGRGRSASGITVEVAVQRSTIIVVVVISTIRITVERSDVTVPTHAGVEVAVVPVVVLLVLTLPFKLPLKLPQLLLPFWLQLP